MKNINKMSIIGVLLVIVIASIIILQEKERKEVTIINQEKPDIEKVVEERRTEVRIDKKFDIERDRLSFKTNKNGEFHATYILTHNAEKKEKIIFYAMTDENQSPITMKINGKNATYHTVEVPKKGEVKVDFSLLDLPKGKHIIYILSEKYIDKKVSDELEKTQTQKVFTGNYFSLEVLKGNNTFASEDRFKSVKRIADSYEEDLLTLHLFSDPELSSKVISVENKNYYLMINNHNEFELKAHLKLLADYNSEELNQIIVPGNSRVMLPVNLENLKAQESIRFVLLGEPTKKIDVDFPVRIIQKSGRIPIK